MLQRIAKAWATTEELRIDRWSDAHSADVIEQLAAHAELASRSRMRLFLRVVA